ncbi:hypothetical protein KSD_09620 [Ktedonobacter sp. SOSP1-85]|uniref:hypothetical protein n=1 Tax=Ktedonobacter sp. SOSP1-85 TaxID=2778367 RepID=UPI0019167D0E|nr:hypothetical protein [Ktedonobacter sp. SOSP1-85]GHO73191.1 hypothetical protein KSD_09620 [Ktedonobacter sp. SOSP1-85]
MSDNNYYDDHTMPARPYPPGGPQNRPQPENPQGKLVLGNFNNANVPPANSPTNRHRGDHIIPHTMRGHATLNRADQFPQPILLARKPILLALPPIRRRKTEKNCPVPRAGQRGADALVVRLAV